MTTFQPRKRRSNRLLTNLAIKAISECFNGSSKSEWTIGENTKVKQTPGNICVYLYDNPIINIHLEGKTVQTVTILGGNYYDKNGNPTYLTMERVNGILDYLGSLKIIPQPVRLFINKEDGVCFIDFTEGKLCFNNNYCSEITIKSHPSKFIALQHSC